jgi:hypothetical protein
MSSTGDLRKRGQQQAAPVKPMSGAGGNGWSSTKKRVPYRKARNIPLWEQLKGLNMPSWPLWKWAVFAGYACFALVWVLAIFQGAWSVFAPFYETVSTKMYPTYKGGNAADLLYMDLQAEYLGDDLEVKWFGPMENFKEGEAIKECRLYCIQHEHCVFFSVFAENWMQQNDQRDNSMIGCWLKGIAVTDRVASIRMDSGVLLNRITPNQQRFFAPGMPQIFAEEDVLETEFPAHTLAIKRNEEFETFYGPAGLYFSGFTNVETPSLILCYRSCAERNVGQGQDLCTDFIYRRSNKNCYLQSLSQGLAGANIA